MSQFVFSKVLSPTVAIPDINHLFYMASSTAVVIEAHENFQKRSCRNRFGLIDHQGQKTLSIPLKKGKNNQMPIKEVEIAHHSNWQEQHLRSIKTAYGKSAYFDYYFDDFSRIYNQNTDLLIEFNQQVLSWISQKMSLQLTYSESESYKKDVEANTLDIRNQIPEIENPYYAQVFEDRLGFIAGSSALDLLFCLGPETSYYLKNMKASPIFKR